MSKEFQGFHGASVERDEATNTFRFVLPFPAAASGRIVVTTRGGIDTDPAVVYQTGKRDVLQQAAELAPGDDQAIWQARFEGQQKIVRRGQIVRPYQSGQMDAATAMNRLVEAGFAPMEAAAAMEQGE